MATACRSPPDSVPTVCSGPRTSMPIFISSSRITCFACAVSSRRSAGAGCKRAIRAGEDKEGPRAGEWKPPRGSPAREDPPGEPPPMEAGAGGAAQRGPEPASEQAAADHRRDDVEELVPDALLG